MSVTGHSEPLAREAMRLLLYSSPPLAFLGPRVSAKEWYALPIDDSLSRDVELFPIRDDSSSSRARITDYSLRVTGVHFLTDGTLSA